MRTQTIYAVLYMLVFASCVSDNDIQKPVVPDVGYIKAKVNGKEQVFTIPSDELGANCIRPGVVNLTFRENTNSTKYWSITIYHSYVALDVHDLPLPFIISGPTPNVDGKLPEAHVAIGDNHVGFYGTMYAQGSTFDHPFTVTLTSVEGNVVRGTFHGKAFGVFKEGSFAAELPVESW